MSTQLLCRCNCGYCGPKGVELYENLLIHNLRGSSSPPCPYGCRFCLTNVILSRLLKPLQRGVRRLQVYRRYDVLRNREILGHTHLLHISSK